MRTFITETKNKLERILVNNNRYQREKPLLVVMEEKVCGRPQEEKLILSLSSEGNCQKLSFPVPFEDEHGNLVIGRRVQRAVGTWSHLGVEYNYWQLMAWLLTGRIETAFPKAGMRSQLERMVLGFGSSSAPLLFRSFQERIDEVVNKLPLVGTPYEAWAMCNRVVFLDPSFDELTPDEALAYQKEMNIKHFPWTSLGLSDSAMVNNCLLKVDLRKYTPFGVKHHNPMRNLYQTLGMQGDENPAVLTESAYRLAEQGVERWGWNWMTCYLDLPANFEDQLIIDNRHLDKITSEHRKIICFGEVKVYAGQELSEGQVIAVEPGGKSIHWYTKCDNAIVTDVESDTVVFNGEERAVQVVYIRTQHIFKEGVKLTNCHGNKGVATFADCGVMYDRVRDCEVPVDIIVSAQTVGKRRNYGQILEVLTTLLNGIDEELVIPDDAETSLKEIQQALQEAGYSADGTSTVRNQWGQFKAVCGWGFWGLIKNPEGQLWNKEEVLTTDNRGRRVAGTKVSHIELKGLTTIFGPQNPVVEEILSHRQGVEDVVEMVKVLEVMRGKPMKEAVLDWSAIKPLAQQRSYFHSQEELKGTIIDETLCPQGFALRLPRVYHVYIPDDTRGEVKEQLLSNQEDLEKQALPDGRNIFFNTIYVPHMNLRNSWEHATGLWGLSDIGGYLNNIVSSCHRLNRGEVEEANLFQAVQRYFHRISQRMSTKRGEVATYALAVRYPNSAKATATLAKDSLPADTIEIHKQMADDLGVRTGSFVIVERFPCLGFKSLRIQKVRVTSDPQCQYVVRVSGNSLVSQNLDFDGDVLFLMSFKTKEANAALEKEFHQPDELHKFFIDEANQSKQQRTKELKLADYNISSFSDLTAARQAEIVGSLTGVKRGTGTAVAFAYNLMRIIEGSVGYKDKITNLALEVILDKVANSVFSQKHAGESLEERCRRAVCLADVDDMLAMGFPERGSRKLCEIVRSEAQKLGVTDLDGHFRAHKTKGRSNIISQIVREKHPLYFATRANLHPVRFLEHLDAPATDLVSHLWKKGLSNKEAKYAKD